jgi:hypothetical protein
MSEGANMSANILEGLIEKKEAAKELGHCYRTMDNWEKRLGLRPLKHGRKKYSVVEELKRAIRGGAASRRPGRPAKI